LMPIMADLAASAAGAGARCGQHRAALRRGYGSKAAHVQQPPVLLMASKLPKAASEADGWADVPAEARKMCWR
jgi:hypothetical protein